MTRNDGVSRRPSLVVIAAALTVLAAFAFGTSTADAVDPKSVRDDRLADLVESNRQVAAAMADGAVDVGEVRQSLSRAVGCLEASGVAVTHASFEANGSLSLTYVGGTTAAEADRADEEQARCFTQHFDPMGDAYGLANHPSNEDLERFRQAHLECLRDSGVTVDADGNTSDRAVARVCAVESDALVFGE